MFVVCRNMSPIVFFVIIWCSVQYTISVKILVVVPHPARSHVKAFEAYFLKLAERGHHVTVVSHFPIRRKVKNYREISVEGSIPSRLNSINVTDMNGGLLPLLYGIARRAARYEVSLKHEALQSLLQSEERFDLLITDAFVSRLYLALVEKYNVPFVYLSSNIYFANTAFNLGDYVNPAYVSTPLCGCSWKMDFMDR